MKLKQKLSLLTTLKLTVLGEYHSKMNQTVTQLKNVRVTPDLEVEQKLLSQIASNLSEINQLLYQLDSLKDENFNL